MSQIHQLRRHHIARLTSRRELAVRSVDPGTFLAALLEAGPEVAKVLGGMLKRFEAPPVSREDFLVILDKSACSSFATALTKHWGFPG